MLIALICLFSYILLAAVTAVIAKRLKINETADGDFAFAIFWPASWVLLGMLMLYVSLVDNCDKLAAWLEERM